MKIALYDFAASPASYNILDFLAGAKAGGGPLHVLIVPGYANGFKADRKRVSADEKRWRVMHIVIPAIRSAGATFTVCPNRDFARLFKWDYPEGATLDHPVRAHTMEQTVRHGPVDFRPSKAATEYVGRWLGTDKPVVTVTLRETYIAVRNSNIAAYRKLPGLFPEYEFVFIPDFEQIWKRDQEDFSLPAIDFDTRLALYDRAVMNLGTLAGPAVACCYGRYPYLLFHPVYEPTSEGFVPTAEKMAEWEFPVGSQFRWKTPKQKIVWERETEDRIVEEFRAIL